MDRKFKVKAVIFDRDGVIINTEDIIIYAITTAFKQINITPPEKYMKLLIGRGPDVFKDFAKENSKFEYEKFREVQRELFYKNLDKAEYFEDVIKLIENLYSKQIPIAVTTSAALEGTKRILNQKKILDKLSVLITREDCANLKPHPEPYLLTAKKLKLKPDECLVLEDTELGVEAAKSAGMYCFAIPNKHTIHQNFSKADKNITSALEVLNLVEFD